MAAGGEAKPTKAQRQAEIQQEAHAVTQTIEKTLEESQGKDYVFPSLDLLTPPSRGKAKAARQELTGTMGACPGCSPPLASTATSPGPYRAPP